MVEIRRYDHCYVKRWFKKNGHHGGSYASYAYSYYTCRLHHPDSAEVAEIRQELAAGASKISVAARHQLGRTSHRLTRLLRKWETMYPVVVPHVGEPQTSKQQVNKKQTFTNTDLDYLLRSFD